MRVSRTTTDGSLPDPLMPCAVAMVLDKFSP